MNSGSTNIFGRRASLAVAALLALGAAACGCSSNVTTLNSRQDFDRVAMRSSRPVLVQFSKVGCSECGLLLPIMDKLALEYEGRATVASYNLMSMFFQVNDQELRDRYDVTRYPTVVLIVNGKCTRKWVLSYDVKSYRRALDEYTAPASGGEGGAQAARVAAPQAPAPPAARPAPASPPRAAATAR